MQQLKMVVCGPSDLLTEAGVRSYAGCIEVNSLEEFTDYMDADIYINFNENALAYQYGELSPVLVNSVLECLPQKSENLYRFNGWPGFLQRATWEISGKSNEKVKDALAALGKDTLWVADVPGLVAARVVSMIINEAFFALEDKTSTREEIDIAMKLGTGYPFGPFEWAEKIGADKISKLLQYLSVTDSRYSPSLLLSGQPEHP